MPKFDEVPDLLLTRAYEHAQTTDFPGEFREDHLISLAADFASPAFVKSAIPLLVRRKHMVQVLVSPAVYEITAEGFLHAEKLVFGERERETGGRPETPGQTKSSFGQKLDPRSSTWDEAVWDESEWANQSGALVDASGGVFALGSSELGNVPAADRYVSRSDNQESWEAAVEALDAVIAEFKKDHPRDNEMGSEKPALLQALHAGRMLLDDTRMDVQIGTALLVEPLKLLITRYENQLVGALASTAFLVIAKLLGLL